MTKPSSKRFISLDAFRGFTIMLMILVNNPGSWNHVYGPFRHAQWHGCTLTDLVFPFFLFIVGGAMAFSFARRMEASESHIPIYLKIVRRTLVLIVLGLFMYLYPHFEFSTMRIPGVLQRIGLCYFCASMIILHTGNRGRIFWCVGLLLGYWAAMVFIPFPGKGSDPWVLGGNLAQYIDNLLFKRHMWTPDFDPEGLLSTVPAVVHVLFGYLAGDWIRSPRDTLTKTNGLFIAANAALVAGFLWAQWMPLNKQLWTSSYVLVTTGIALHLLSVSFWLMDVKGLHRFTRPFIIFGSNAILVYVLSSLTAKTLIRVWQWDSEDAGSVSAWSYGYDRIFQPVFGNAFGSLMMALVFVSFWLGMMTILYRKRVFIKI